MPETVTCDAWVPKELEHARPAAAEAEEVEVRTRFVNFIRAEAHGIIWPSVVVMKKPDDCGTHIRVRGLAFRYRGGVT